MAPSGSAGCERARPDLRLIRRPSSAASNLLQAEGLGFPYRRRPDVDRRVQAIVRRTPCLGLGWRQFNPAPSDKVVGRRFHGNLGLRLTIVVKPDRAEAALSRRCCRPRPVPVDRQRDRASSTASPSTASAPSRSAPRPQAYAEGYDDAGMAMATLDIALLAAIGDVGGDLESRPTSSALISEFEPWPDGQERDATLDLRQP